MITATKIRDLGREWSDIADGRLYRLSEPVPDGYGNPTEYVVVSAVTVPVTGPETYIFPADENGETPNMMDMPGSMRGVLDHSLAIKNAGWELSQ